MTKLNKKEAEAARKRSEDYIANMAVEGLEMHPEDRALLDKVNAEGVGYEEAIEMAKEQLRKRGVIPMTDQVSPDIDV